MLTRLRFKNWRSLKDVEIPDLTPITVFIGANSSGKTNIIDALRFLQLMVEQDTPEAVYRQRNRERIHTLGVADTESIEIEVEFDKRLTYSLGIETENSHLHFIERGFDGLTKQRLESKDGKGHVGPGGLGRSGNEIHLLLPMMARISNNRGITFDVELSGGQTVPKFAIYEQFFRFVTERWQFLDGNFMPLVRLSLNGFSNTYKIDSDARNMTWILDFMKEAHPSIYSTLKDDLSWLAEHVSSLETENVESEIKLSIREKAHPDQEAPTISAGTGRIAAMLTAYYALDMRNAEMPGLVVIEEPDTALNPGLLGRFVEQLRLYTEREHPRQFILTTHNPAFLDFFEPEEVRVVERDENGYTSVSKIPDHIREIWLDKYALGEVWTTNSFGGLPQ